ncbi:hypothetical protein NEAUS03_0651 [Nematocida ausubeli]|nr:hypothetical protein NEAUS03_0651 [Nematocida ausubeli]
MAYSKGHRKDKKPFHGKDKPHRNAPTYYRGEKQQTQKPRTKLTRNVVNKTFRTDSELTEFILTEGTFKDRVTAMALIIIKEQNRKALEDLIHILENTEGGDKAYLAITHAVKVAEYYLQCKKQKSDTPANEEENSSDSISEEIKELDGESEEIKEAEKKAEEEEKIDEDKFCQFIERSGFIKRLVAALAKQLEFPFLKEKIAILIKSMIEADTLSGQMIDILLDAADHQIDKEIAAIFTYIVRNRKINLISILRDKITQTILSHKNMRKVKYFVTLALLLNKSEWVQEDADYHVYVYPLIKGFSQILKKVAEEVDNPAIKSKSGLAVVSSLLKGLLRFIKWQRTIPSLKKNYTEEIVKDIGYIFFKMAYNENTKYSLPALNILETINETEKINYSRVLGDTIRKYIYLNDLSRCEILNKAVNVPEKEVQTKVIQSAYHAPIGSKYPLGCQMVSQEAGIDVQGRLGYILLTDSYDKETAESAEMLVQGKAIPVYNIWS